MDLTAVVGTFGDLSWRDLAWMRAIPSAQAQGMAVVHVHDETLAKSRNAALAQVKTEWVIHLDADDELMPGYVEAMEKGTADVRGPMVRFIERTGQPDERWRNWQPRVINHEHDCTADCLPEGNWLVIGSMARTDLIREVGGWEEWPVYEDWALWLRCWKAGATFELVKEAYYCAHHDPGSRNRGSSPQFRLQTHREIERVLIA